VNRSLSELPPLRGVFITGTDTDVGKTWVAAGLTAALRQQGVKAVYFKPVQSGCRREGGRLIPTDADFARTLAGLTEPLEVLTPIALRLPLAPGVAWLFDSIQNMTGRGGAAETVLSMPGQAMHGKVGELGKSVLKLQGNAVVLVGSGITTFMTPVSGTALNVVEGFTGTTGLSPAFLLGQALRQAEGLPSKNVKHTIRTPYEKVVHILMGGFEKGSGKGPDILSQYGLSPEQVKEMVNDARNQVPGKTDYQPVIDAAKQWLKEYEAGKKTRLSTKEIP